jgi:hypothetical protein
MQTVVFSLETQIKYCFLETQITSWFRDHVLERRAPT